MEKSKKKPQARPAIEPNQRFLKESQAAVFLAMRATTLRKIRVGEIELAHPVPFMMRGRNIVYDREQLIDWMHLFQVVPPGAVRSDAFPERAG